jgi:transcription termination factor NusB
MKKADNFDAKQWLVENKVTTQSRLNEDWLPHKDMSNEEYNESFKKFVISTLKQHEVIDEHIEIYLDDILKADDIKAYEGISDKNLYEDFLEFKNDQIEQDEDLYDFDF